MAGRSLYRDEDVSAISDINVTPLVDVTLVLLIIFMVTAKLIVARGISVETPRTASGQDIKSSLQVTIDHERKIYVNGTHYPTVAGAKERVSELAAGNENIKAIITADRRVPHGDVMQVIDFVKLAGVLRFGLTADALTEEPAAGD